MAKMWKYISGVSKVVDEKKNEKALKAAHDMREYGRVKTGLGECILRVTRLNGECSQN